MSVKYIPVQWNRNKWFYDWIMLIGVAVFLWVFFSPVLNCLATNIQLIRKCITPAHLEPAHL